MIITVKPLQGTECSLQVTEDEKVCVVKQQVCEQLNIPVNQQRLLYKGKALADEHSLRDYCIGAEARLNLVVRPAAERSSSSMNSSSSISVPQQQQGAWPLLSAILARHFSPADAARVHEQLLKDYERSLRQLSLDDIERFSGRLLHPDDAVEGVDSSSSSSSCYMD